MPQQINSLPNIQFNSWSHHDVDGKRYCRGCSRTLSLSEFRMQDKTRRRRLCKSCHSEYIRKRKFNLEDNEYQKLLEKQNGRCAICQSDTPEKRSLAVDHCHETDKIRGLLCSKCNTGIGSFKDNIQLLENAIAYLNKEKD